MGLKDSILATVAMGAMAESMLTTRTSGRKRRQTDYEHFTPDQWAKRKKRLKMQKKSRKINRQRA